MNDQIAVRCVYRATQWNGLTFRLCIGIDQAGGVHALSATVSDEWSACDRTQIDRAVFYIRAALWFGTKAGLLATDMLRELPDGPAFEIERRILHQVAVVQALRAPCGGYTCGAA